MNLYLLSQTQWTGYDTYDSCVVCAANEVEARKIHPSRFIYKNPEDAWKSSSGSWCDTPEQVDVLLIGTAAENVAQGGVICASFNAG